MFGLETRTETTTFMLQVGVGRKSCSWNKSGESAGGNKTNCGDCELLFWVNAADSLTTIRKDRLSFVVQHLAEHKREFLPVHLVLFYEPIRNFSLFNKSCSFDPSWAGLGRLAPVTAVRPEPVHAPWGEFFGGARLWSETCSNVVKDIILS